MVWGLFLLNKFCVILHAINFGITWMYFASFFWKIDFFICISVEIVKLYAETCTCQWLCQYKEILSFGSQSMWCVLTLLDGPFGHRTSYGGFKISWPACLCLSTLNDKTLGSASAYHVKNTGD